MLQRTRNFFSLIFLAAMLSSCLPQAGGIQLPSLEIPLREFPTSQPTVVPTSTATLPPGTPTIPAAASGQQVAAPVATSTPMPYPLWIDSSVPDALRGQTQAWNLPLAGDASHSILQLGPAEPTDTNRTIWIYALVAPFSTTLDGVTLFQVQSAWNASASGPLGGSPLWMTESTRSALTALWGEADTGSVKTVPADELIDDLWANQPSWGIVPFEALDPKLKVLSVDGQSPVRNDFDADAYPLKVDFSLTGSIPTSLALPASNRDPSKLTVVLMTGVTAMVRATASRMEIAGVDYPEWNIGDTLRAADITHISNEIPFTPACPYPDPNQEGLVFCSNPKYIELMDLVGTDVVELTGNHFQDYGSEATLYTLSLYDERHWPYYGGGANLADSQKPALITHNGNRFAFIGCNPVGPPFAWATETQPGAAPCGDYEWIKSEISDLAAQGYIVIATFQYIEYYEPVPTEQHVKDFRAIADAGATIVDGSQAHIPQAMEFYDGAFIHYGLGNLFFDQMAGPSRREFLDRDVFYDGRYISTELVTAMLEDYARPRLMKPNERETFLKSMFEVSGWLKP